MPDQRPSDSLARFTAPVLLIVVALTQLVLTRTTDLTPWKGGGFGMFTVVDSMYGRIWSVEVENAEGEPMKVLARPPGPLATHLDARQQSFPTEAVLSQAADQALGLHYEPVTYSDATLWRHWGLAANAAPQSIQDATYALPLSTALPGMPQSGQPVNRVTVQMLKPRFSPSELQLSWEPFGTAVARVR
jgi:hypothetical protein